jgi:hypothetical protein
MTGRTFPGEIKRASALRRIPFFDCVRYVETAGREGLVCVFELTSDQAPIVLESDVGRAMSVTPGDFFLGTPGYRESTRWVVGTIPPGGLVPQRDYSVLSESGVIGELVGDSPLRKDHLGKVKFHGVVIDDGGSPFALGQFAAAADDSAQDYGAPLFLLVGTSAEVGKTTAGIGLLRALRQKGCTTVTALKATGTASVTETMRYRDFGAARAFDSVDFGLATTYPSGRADIEAVFERAADAVLSIASEAVIVECGGDILGGNVPVLLGCLQRRRSGMKIILAAADALGAFGAKQVLGGMGLTVTLITGPCTDTPTLRERTQSLCEIPAVNLSRGANLAIF